MTTPSRTGLILAGAYVLLCVFLIATQGLFGESFIAILLGLPWSMAFAAFEFGNVSGAMIYVLVLAPLVLNALVLYGIGYLLGRGGMNIVAYVLATLIVLVGGFFAFNHYIYSEKQGDTAGIESYRGTLTGEVVCLPHADTEGPNTMECAFGIRTDANEYYALDFTLMSQEHPVVNTGERITANGMITPLELLSTDHWRKYAIEGIFSVTDSVQKL